MEPRIRFYTRTLYNTEYKEVIKHSLSHKQKAQKGSISEPKKILHNKRCARGTAAAHFGQALYFRMTDGASQLTNYPTSFRFITLLLGYGIVHPVALSLYHKISMIWYWIIGEDGSLGATSVPKYI